MFHFGSVVETGYDWKYLIRSYKRYVKKSDVVLEIGASVKNKTVELSKYCKKLIGVELMPERTPRSFKNIEYKTGDWQKLTEFIPKESIDVAVSSHTIEHVPNDLVAINQLYSVLKKNGKALITTPNRKRLTRTIIELFTGEKKFPTWEHVREYTIKDMEELILKSKFKSNFQIIPLVFGLHGGYLFVYVESPQENFKNLANYLFVILNKQ